MTEDRNRRDDLKISDYSYLDDSPIEGWLWEITRRNPSYRQAWRSHQSTFKERSFVTGSYMVDAKEAHNARKFGLLFFY